MAEEAGTAQAGAELRRDVTVWGSYMWGFADVGADTFVALGLVFAWAQGASVLAFALAGLVYIMIGLAYTELASAYPVAGGGQYFTMRGLGDTAGFIAGSALLLDYTIDIALFSVASAGYLNFFLPYFGAHIDQFTVSFGPIRDFNWLWCGESLAIIGFLIWLNVKGMRESSLVNEVIGVLVIATESLLIVAGFVLAWDPGLLAHQWRTEFPSWRDFAYGSSLAIISFVGLESISQAAQETKRPATIVPRTSISLIFTVFVFATGFSTLALGLLDWRVLAEHEGEPVAQVARAIPFIGTIAGPFTALLGFAILLISSNSGVMSASRVTFSMSQFDLLSRWFNKVHPRYKTPVRTIVIFSLIGAVQTVLAFLAGRGRAMDVLGNVYAFGATLGYILVFISLIKLRFSDPYSPRPYLVPFNIRINRRGRQVQFPLLAVLGMLGVSTIFFTVIWTHAIGRIAGPAWVVATFLYYAWYRRRNGMSVWRNVPRNWEQQQMQVLASAEEFDLLEQYKISLAERDRHRRSILDSEYY